MVSETEFATQVTELKRLGLNAASLGQIVQAGPDQGSPLAGLAAGLKAELAGLDEAMKTLGASMAAALRKERDTWT